MNPILLTLMLATIGAAAPADREKPLREAIWGGHFIAGVRLYDELKREGVEPSAQASYLAGYAEWMLRKPEDARPLLESARQRGFRAGGDRPQAEELLARIDDYLAVKPPAAKVPDLDRSVIDSYADEQTPLTRPVLEALPRIAEIGRGIFPDLPPVRFVLLARKPALARFYDAMKMTRGESSSPHSTGVANMVIYCEEKAHRRTQSETVSIALHETVHAWIAGYLRKRYDRPIPVPPYVDEGLAVYVASLWSDDVHALAPQGLAAWHRSHDAPTFEDLSSSDHFFDPENRYPDYLLADMLVERLLGPPRSGAAKIPALLDAYARTGDATAAWREVTGKDVRREYEALVSEIWR